MSNEFEFDFGTQQPTIDEETRSYTRIMILTQHRDRTELHNDLVERGLSSSQANDLIEKTVRNILAESRAAKRQTEQQKAYEQQGRRAQRQHEAANRPSPADAMAQGVFMIVAGIAVTVASTAILDGGFVLFYGLILVGVFRLLGGFFRMLMP